MTEHRTVEMFMEGTRGIPTWQLGAAMTQLDCQVHTFCRDLPRPTKIILAERWSNPSAFGVLSGVSIDDILKAIIRRYPSTWSRNNARLAAFAKALDV